MGDQDPPRETPTETIFRIMQQNQLRTNEAINNLSAMMAELMREKREREAQREAPREPQRDQGLRVEVETFDGVLNGEKYLEWEKSLERFFEFKEIPEEQKYKCAKVKLTKYAETWLDGEQSKRVAMGKARISTWPKLKKRLRGRFIPTNYKQNLYVRWSTLKQGSMMVEDYIREFEKLAIMCEIVESEELKMGRFLAGLDRDIYDKVEVYPNLSYDEACKLAIKFDHQKKRKKNSGSSSLENKTLFETPTKDLPYKPPQSPLFSKTTKEKSIPKESDLSEVVCFKCRGRGHYKQDCPNPRALNTFEKKVMVGQLLAYEKEKNKEKESESEVEEEETYEEEEDCFPEMSSLVVRRTLQTHVVEEDAPQRQQLFVTKCKIQEEICDLIVDSGSEINTISKNLVAKLELPTTNHPCPYRLSWLDNGTHTRVRKQCLISFSIGSYRDTQLCDVVNMDACHLLLGRPWQSDKKSLHDGYLNTYTINHNGKKKTLHPLPPLRPKHHPPNDTTQKPSPQELSPQKTKPQDPILQKPNPQNQSPKEPNPKGFLLLSQKTFVHENTKAQGQTKTKPELHQEARKGHGKAKKRAKKKTKAREKNFQIGDLVWVSLHKKQFPQQGKHERLPRDEGPFKIMKKMDTSFYKVDLGHGVQGTFNISHLTPCFDESNLRTNLFEDGEYDPCGSRSVLQVQSHAPSLANFVPSPKATIMHGPGFNKKDTNDSTIRTTSETNNEKTHWFTKGCVVSQSGRMK